MDDGTKPLARLNPNGLRVVLVLQGGGALGAYQGGVSQALYEHGLAPDWIVGTSIGAMNGALLAGNAPHRRMARLREFWATIAQPGASMLGARNPLALHHYGVLAALRTLGAGVPGFFRPSADLRFALGWPVPPEHAGLYDTAAMQRTLTRLIDFDVLNSAASPRFSANVLTVRDGALVSFDSGRQRLDLRHVRASAALPPAFAPVRIDGELYWDGGMYSNTPLQTVFDDAPQRDSLVFMVDLWNEHGAAPTTMDAAMTHRKDAFYATRSRRQLDDYERLQRMRRLVRACRDLLPDAARADAEALAGPGSDCRLHIVRLQHAVAPPYTPAKDLDFTAGTLDWRWQRGYDDTCRMLGLAPWLSPPPADAPLVLHQLPAFDSNVAPVTDNERKDHVFSQ